MKFDHRNGVIYDNEKATDRQNKLKSYQSRPNTQQSVSMLKSTSGYPIPNVPYSDKSNDDFIVINRAVDLSRSGTPIDTRAKVIAVSKNFDSLGFEISHKTPMKAPGTANNGSMRKYKIISKKN